MSKLWEEAKLTQREAQLCPTTSGGPKGSLELKWPARVVPSWAEMTGSSISHWTWATSEGVALSAP